MSVAPQPPQTTVRELVEQSSAALRLRLLAGEAGLDLAITSARVQKPGLALGGFGRSPLSGRVQVLGRSEMAYLAELDAARRAAVVAGLCEAPVPCLVVTTGIEPPEELRAAAERRAIPLLQTPVSSGEAIERLTRHLERELAPRVIEHGVLMEVCGLGVLILGESGVGKSECALDLVVRGHRLVSDDVVEIRRIGEALVGSGPELTRYLMEVRGLGLINIKELYGVASVRAEKAVELIVRLDPWKEGKAYDRLGVDPRETEILGVRVPSLEMPVAPGRNLSVLVEVATRHQMLKMRGTHPARELARRLDERLRGAGVCPAEEDAPSDPAGRGAGTADRPGDGG